KIGTGTGREIYALAINFISDGDFQLIESAENIQLGEKQFGEAAHLCSIAQDNAIQPATAPGTSGRGAIFIPKVFAGTAQSITEFAMKFSGHRASPHPRRK